MRGPSWHLCDKYHSEFLRFFFFNEQSLSVPVSMVRLLLLNRQTTYSGVYSSLKEGKMKPEFNFGRPYTSKSPIFPKSLWFAISMLNLRFRTSRSTEGRRAWPKWCNSTHVKGVHGWKYQFFLMGIMPRIFIWKSQKWSVINILRCVRNPYHLTGIGMYKIIW